MRNRIVTAVKQRFSIRKLSIGAASVLLGTSLYFMGGSATIVHADTNVSGDAPQTETSNTPASAGVDGSSGQQKAPTNDKINKSELDSIAKNNDNNDTAVNDAIDKYAQVKQEEVGDNALIRASDKEPTTIATTASQRGEQVDTIAKQLDQAVKNANQEAQKINDYKNAHPNTVSGEGAQHFADQGLSIDDEPDSEINQITVDHNNKDKGNTLSKGQSETIDGIHITHTDKMTHKEQYVMKINSDNKVIVDFQHNQCSGKEITVTYDDLKNSYYLENINNKTNKIKISKIERTFSHIQEADKIRFTSDGQTPKGADGAYDKCYGPQLIIYNDPSDGFFYNNITQVSVKDIYYDDQGSQINFDTKNDNNKAWIFVTSLNSNGGGNVERVSAQGPNNSSVDVEKIAGSTVTNHNGLWYSDNNNNFGGNPDWDNRDEANRFGFVGTVAVQYHPGMTLQYSVEDWQWGSHWACTQTQVVSSLDTPVIIYDHIKDGAVPVTPKTPSTDIPKNTVKEAQPDQLTKEVHLTVNYENSDGATFTGDVPTNHKQQVTFTGTAYVDKVTGELVNAKQQADGTWVVDDSKTDKPQVIWTVKDGKDSFDEVISPIERDYHLTKISSHRKGNNVEAISGITHTSDNVEVTVTYAPLGKMIPVDPSGKPIPDAPTPQFPNNP
ncbi:MAG: YSIRK-type signal peptide-containing protein, partial [Lactobacillus johnsonii]|nr:YSIRK-type signal peptide-containing protein [Lactobacillus johnsonii]